MLTCILLIHSLFLGGQPGHDPVRRLISGHVYSHETRAPLVGVHVLLSVNKVLTTTDEKGYFAIRVPADTAATLTFSLVGYASVVQPVATHTNLTVWMVAGHTLSEHVVRATQSMGSSDPQMSVIRLSMENLARVPALLGEKDVLKLMQLMPGVQKGSEGNSSLYVRGGAPDQNLIMLDNVPIYNPNHLLGFFSAFNGDALGRADLTKGGFPARFGGRLSSVVELTTKDGPTDRLHGQATAGVVASHLMLSGPLGRRVTGLLAARRTYLDLLTGLLGQQTADQPLLKTFFYDLNAKLTITAGQNDQLYISGYTSRDRLNNTTADSMALRSDLRWTNGAGSLRWHHRGTGGTTADLTILAGYYSMAVQDQRTPIQSDQDGFYTLRYQSTIRDLGLRYARNHDLGDRHQLRYGLEAIHHRFMPRATVISSQAGPASPTADQPADAVEGGAYLEHTWHPSRHWRINTGLRVSFYRVLTPQANSSPPTYLRPEPRLSVAYQLRPTLALKASYARMNQYLHLLSSTGIGLSSDLWVPTVRAISPQQSQQLALGLGWDVPRRGLTFTLEGYYKRMDHLLTYREGASFLSTDDRGSLSSARWTDNVTSGQGRSYGAEVLLQKQSGRLSGWVGYTLSWTTAQFADLNGGRPFYPRYDRRHDASVVGIYELTPTITLSGTWVYGTGNALTLPLSRYWGYSDQKLTGNPATATTYYGPETNVREYGERNSFRAAAYHRLDVSLRFRRKRSHSERIWELSVYNAYNRRNPFLYSLEGKSQGPNSPSQTTLYKQSLFPAVPSVSYSVRF